MTHDWRTTRERAATAFGSFPPPTDEYELVEAFQRAPVAVERELDRTIAKHAAGTITAPWRIWALNVRSRSDATVQAGPTREQLQARAEQWLHAAGVHFPTWAEVAHELFERGLGGGLRASVKIPPDLEPVLRPLWESLQAEGQRLAREAEQRCLDWQQQAAVRA